MPDNRIASSDRQAWQSARKSDMAGDPNQLCGGLPVEPRFLFEEIDAGGIGEQMAWLSDAVDRLDGLTDDGGTQATFAEVARDA